MTDRDLSALLERASADVVELDFATDAWARAVAEQRHRRRVVTTTVGAVAAATLAVTTVQLTGSPTPRPAPADTTTTSAAPPTLSDGTAYDELPREGKESGLAHFDAGLPSLITPHGPQTTNFSERGALLAVVAVYLRREGEVYRPVLVAGTGEQRLVDTLGLVPLRDAGGNETLPLGPRAIGGGGRYVAFPQPGKVVLLDVGTGQARNLPVPSDALESVGWTADQGTLVARSADHAWTIDPWKPGAVAAAADGGYEGRFRLVADDTRGLRLHRYDDAAIVDTSAALHAPVDGVWGETIGTEQRAAAGAFFDQVVTSKVIDRGSGPIYQGLVAVDAETGRTRVLLAPENPDGQTGRFKGCCVVLGWADGATVLFQTLGSHGSWVLAWNVANGRVHEVSRIRVDPPREDIPRLAINVGWRF